VDDIQPKWIKPKRASAVYGLGITKLYDLLNQGLLETKKIGASRLIGVASLDRLFADPEPVPAPGGGRKAGDDGLGPSPPADRPRRRGHPRKEAPASPRGQDMTIVGVRGKEQRRVHPRSRAGRGA
jgi:hypothetical protein